MTTAHSSVYVYMQYDEAVSDSVYVHAILVYFAHSAKAYTFQKLTALPIYSPQH